MEECAVELRARSFCGWRRDSAIIMLVYLLAQNTTRIKDCTIFASHRMCDLYCKTTGWTLLFEYWRVLLFLPPTLLPVPHQLMKQRLTWRSICSLFNWSRCWNASYLEAFQTLPYDAWIRQHNGLVVSIVDVVIESSWGYGMLLARLQPRAGNLNERDFPLYISCSNNIINSSHRWELAFRIDYLRRFGIKN